MKNKFKRTAAFLAAQVMCVSTALCFPVNAIDTDSGLSDSTAGDVVIDEASFPDEVFRDYIKKNFDFNSDGILTSKEILRVTDINVEYDTFESSIDMKISSLEGIEHFTYLECLSCANNNLTKLDVSGLSKLLLLDCDGNQIEALNLKGCTSLINLYCNSNYLTSIDVSGISSLESLYCNENRLESLDVSGLTNLCSLSCNTNQLISLDVSDCIALTALDCSYNDLFYLNVSGLTRLKNLQCFNNDLINLDVSGLTSLLMFDCDKNQLENLNLEGCKSLRELFIAFNKLTTVDVSDCTDLEVFFFDENQLTSLDLSSNTNILRSEGIYNRYQIRTDGNTFDLSKLPTGFDIEKASEWKNGTVESNILTINEGAKDVTYKYDLGQERSEIFTLKIAPPLPAEKLAAGATRVTLYDKNGELVPDKLVEAMGWGFGTNIGIKNPNISGGWMYTGPIFYLDSNPCIVDTTQLADLYRSADIFEVRGLKNNEKPEIIYHENGSLDLVFTISTESTTFTIFDYDTREKIELPDEAFLRFNNYNSSEASVYSLSSNPASFSGVNKSLDYYGYKFDTKTSSGYYNPVSYQVVTESEDEISVNLYVEWKAKGDVNGDGKLTVADAVLVGKWLLGKSDVEFVDWKGADYIRDNMLNVYDMIKLRQRLVEKEYVEPGVNLKYGIPMEVIADEVKLYLGPDESYDCAAVIPNGTQLEEKGYNENDDNWVFVEYQGQHGWLKFYDENEDAYTIIFLNATRKPVIYFYPEEETDVHVELELTESELATTYPKYNNGWDVTAYPDGSLVNKADGSNHKYLFWDAKNCRTRYDMSKGFCVAGSDTEKFLKEKLTYMGLTEQEMNEFIVYWLPEMESNEYNLITFQGEAYTESSKLNITPTPDSLCRVFMVFTALDEPVDIQPQELETFERNGFTVIEWGGSEIGIRD